MTISNRGLKAVSSNESPGWTIPFLDVKIGVFWKSESGFIEWYRNVASYNYEWQNEMKTIFLERITDDFFILISFRQFSNSQGCHHHIQM